MEVILNPGEIVTCEFVNVRQVPIFRITDSSLCTFDIDETTIDVEFRDIFTPNPLNPAYFTDTATNPGQYYQNIIVEGPPGTIVPISDTVPYPFVTHGATPIHAYSGVNMINQDGNECFVPSGDPVPFTIDLLTAMTPNGNYAVVLGDYGATPFIDTDDSPGTTTKTFYIEVTIPSTGIVYINKHMDFGLKKTAPWTKSGSDATPAPLSTNTNPTIFNQALFPFSISGFVGVDQDIKKINVFKRDPGFVGVVLNAENDEPLAGVTVEFWNGSTLIGTDTTDENGYYSYNYVHKGKQTTYTTKLPAYNLQQSGPMKSHGFLVFNFEVDLTP